MGKKRSREPIRKFARQARPARRSRGRNQQRKRPRGPRRCGRPSLQKRCAGERRRREGGGAEGEEDEGRGQLARRVGWKRKSASRGVRCWSFHRLPFPLSVTKVAAGIASANTLLSWLFFCITCATAPRIQIPARLKGTRSGGGAKEGGEDGGERQSDGNKGGGTLLAQLVPRTWRHICVTTSLPLPLPSNHTFLTPHPTLLTVDVWKVARDKFAASHHGRADDGHFAVLVCEAALDVAVDQGLVLTAPWGRWGITAKATSSVVVGSSQSEAAISSSTSASALC